MPPEHLQTYMSWVPLVGSGLGSVLGGIISDAISNEDSTFAS